jgi:hypothetical protein
VYSSETQIAAGRKITQRPNVTAVPSMREITTFVNVFLVSSPRFPLNPAAGMDLILYRPSL